MKTKEIMQLNPILPGWQCSLPFSAHLHCFLVDVCAKDVLLVHELGDLHSLISTSKCLDLHQASLERDCESVRQNQQIRGTDRHLWL